MILRIRRRLALLSVVSAFALPLIACGGADSDEVGASEDDFTQLAAADVVVGDEIEFGERREIGGQAEDARIAAVAFEGKAGDVVHAELAASFTGTGYVFKKTASGKYAIVRQVRSGESSWLNLDVTLTTSGSFFLGFKPAPELDVSWYTANVTLQGTPIDPNTAWLQGLKNAFESGDFLVERDLADVPDAELPKAVRAEVAEWSENFSDYPPSVGSWTFRGKKTFVVAEQHDGGMFIYFWDESGKVIASGGAGESTSFIWD